MRLLATVHKICRSVQVSRSRTATYSVLRYGKTRDKRIFNQTNNDEARRRRASKVSTVVWETSPRGGRCVKLKEIKGAHNLEGLWKLPIFPYSDAWLEKCPLIRKFQLEKYLLSTTWSAKSILIARFLIQRYYIQEDMYSQQTRDTRDIFRSQIWFQARSCRQGWKKKLRTSNIINVISDSLSAFGVS